MRERVWMWEQVLMCYRWVNVGKWERGACLYWYDCVDEFVKCPVIIWYIVLWFYIELYLFISRVKCYCDVMWCTRMNKLIILDLDLVIFSNPQQNGAQWVNGVRLYVTVHDRVLVRLFGAERCWFLHGVKACDGTCRDFAIAVKYRNQLRKLYW